MKAASTSLFVKAQVAVLRRIAPPVPQPLSTVYDGVSKLAALFGPAVLEEIRGRRVVDFGCGYGFQAIELARAGATVIGVEIDDRLLQAARENAERAGVSETCTFTRNPTGQVDLVLSLDCFEHFSDPENVLGQMYNMLVPGGSVIASWGPPWYHPRGAHLNELPPWTHVFFSETAIVEWRLLMRPDNARNYAEMGLGQMTVGGFERLARKSRFAIESLHAVPIRPLRWLHNRWTREFTTSIVQCRLRKLLPNP